MPEALARADHDFVLREPARPAKSRNTVKRKPSRFPFLARLMRRPGRTFLFAGTGLLLTGIGVNALFLQNSRHPAPFFRAQNDAKPVEAQAASVPLPPARPADSALKAQAVKQAALPATPAPVAERAGPAPETKPAAVARENPKEVSRQAASSPKPEPKSDPIAALLRDGRPNAPTPPGSIPNASPDQTKRILAVQEALKKLGHSVKPDGVAGPTTRVAIESFERAQKLQVSGEMSPRVLRELAKSSGVKIP